MKHIFNLVLVMALSVGVCLAGGTVELKDARQKTSYSIGYQVGGDFKRQGITIRPEILLQGIQESLEDQEPTLSKEEMRQALVELQKQVAAEQKLKSKEEAAKNLKEGQDFLARNSQKAEVKTLPSGLQYKVVLEGSGATPNPEDAVTVHYRGTLINGKEFDSSYSRSQPVTFQSNRVIKGWQEALSLMKEGAKWKLFIPPQLAYGEEGAGDQIGPNSTLIFEVELLSVKTREDQPNKQ